MILSRALCINQVMSRNLDNKFINYSIPPKNLLLLHDFIMHLSVSVADPLQGRPPFAGLGESHLLDLVRVPLSQDLEHLLHDAQPPQNPFVGSTASK